MSKSASTKLFSAFLLILLFGGYADMVIADQPVTDFPPGVSVKIAEDVPLSPTPKEALELFNKQRTTSRNIWLGVPRYSQTDPLWRDNIMYTCSLTIGGAGCLLTSASMVFKYYGSGKNPGQVNTCMGTSACPWIFNKGAKDCSDNKAVFLGMYSPNYATFIWALSTDYPPIIEVIKGSSTHWVVINGIYGTGLSDSDYSIIDLLGGVYKRLSDYTYSGWTKNRLAVYGRP